MTATRSAPVGFIGLGAMGEPMALTLVKAGTPLLVWNRTPAKSAILGKAGATVAKDAAEVFAPGAKSSSSCSSTARRWTASSVARRAGSRSE
jgi:glutamyl-tRNA reductase